jgi:hypothetical protein
MNIIRKGQIRWLPPKADIMGQVRFNATTIGVAA